MQEKSAETSPEHTPADVLDVLVAAANIRPGDKDHGSLKAALQTFLKGFLATTTEGTISSILVDYMIVEVDHKLSEQVNEILHHEEFMAAESLWRAFRFLVDNTDFTQNIKVQLLSITKEELLHDFEDSPEVVRSSFYKHLYTAEYGQFGGQPVGVVIADYEFGPGAQDITLLQNISSVCAMAHAPFIAGAGKEFFGIESWSELSNLKDLHYILDMPKYSAWQAFRKQEDSRYIGLTLPRFLLRLPYEENTITAKSFMFQEKTETTESFCWGNTAFALATRIVDSFAKYRWCANIIGPQGGGTVHNLPLYHFETRGEIQTRIPTQVLLSERKEYELAEEGFIGLAMRKGSDNTAFFSANSAQVCKKFAETPEGKEAETNYRLSSQMPYMMIATRLAHYIKVIQREHIGTWKERLVLEAELNKWLSQYVTAMDNPDPVTRSKRPLRMAHISVTEFENTTGWYSIFLQIRPHFKYMGANFSLSLAGKLDREY